VPAAYETAPGYYGSAVTLGGGFFKTELIGHYHELVHPCVTLYVVLQI
jgi:hypothetical protein